MYRKPTLNEKLKSASFSSILGISIICILVGSFIFAFDLRITTIMILVLILISLSIYLLKGSSGFKGDLIALSKNKSIKFEISFLFILLVFIPYPFYIIANYLVKSGVLPRIFLYSASTLMSQPYWAYFLVLIIVGPILEEFLFRGFLLNKLNADFANKKNAFLKAMIITSLLVSLVHGITTFIPVFIMNLGLCIIYFKYDNLLVNCILHILSNLELALILLLVVFKIGKVNKFIMNDPIVSILFIILGIIALVFYIIYLKQNYNLLKFHKLID